MLGVAETFLEPYRMKLHPSWTRPVASVAQSFSPPFMQLPESWYRTWKWSLRHGEEDLFCASPDPSARLRPYTTASGFRLYWRRAPTNQLSGQQCCPQIWPRSNFTNRVYFITEQDHASGLKCAELRICADYIERRDLPADIEERVGAGFLRRIRCVLNVKMPTSSTRCAQINRKPRNRVFL